MFSNKFILIAISIFLSSLACAKTQFMEKIPIKGGRAELLSPMALQFINSRGGIISGSHVYFPKPASFTVQDPVTGVTSVNPVHATVKYSVPKKTVLANVLKNAKTYGKMGLRRFGWTGLAFTLAELALQNSEFSWSDKHGDFVRPNDKGTYIVFVTRNTALVSSPDKLTDAQYKEFCAIKPLSGKPNLGCLTLGFVKSEKQGWQKGLAYCKTVPFGGDGYSKLHYGDSLGERNECAAQKGWEVSDERIHVVKYVDLLPISQEEFDRLADPAINSEPDKWVDASKPSENAPVPGAEKPKVIVPNGATAQSAPYTDPQTNRPVQMRWDFTTINDHTTVNITTIPRDDLAPNSPQAPTAPLPNASASQPATSPNNPSEQAPDFCEKHPDALACDRLPEPVAEDELPPLPSEPINLNFQADGLFPNSANCPAPVQFEAFGKTYGFSLQPACDVAVALRPVLLAFAWLVAAFFVIKTIRSEA